jgi:hypothetical protein
LQFLLNNVFGEELGERFRDFTLDKFGDALEGIYSTLEFVEIF